MIKSDFNLQNLLRDNIKLMKPYSSARDEFKETTRGMVFIDANENPFENGLNRYPDPQQRELKQRLSEIKNISERQILLGNGSDEVLDLIFRAFCDPNQDKVITLPPTYGMYSVLANLNSVENIEIELESNFQPNVNVILNAVNQQTKLLLLCSPNNPTANSFQAGLIEVLLSEFNGIVVIDEAYIDFSSQESWLNRLDEFPNLIVTQTLSKAFGMAGIRLGICYASEAIIAILNKIKPPYNINQLSQLHAVERLKQLDTITNEVNAILIERERLQSELQKVNFVNIIYDSDANFLLVKVDNANKRYEQLIRHGIVVRNRTTQPLCYNCLRLTVGTKEENDKLIEILKSL